MQDNSHMGDGRSKRKTHAMAGRVAIAWPCAATVLSRSRTTDQRCAPRRVIGLDAARNPWARPWSTYVIKRERLAGMNDSKARVL